MASLGFQNHLGLFAARSNQLVHHRLRLVFQSRQQANRYPQHLNPTRLLAANTNSNSNPTTTTTTTTTTIPHQHIPTSSPPPPSIRDQGWVSFAEKVSGEWDGYGADFSNSGEPIQLPESVVPEAFREWDVKVFDWQTQCPTLAHPQPQPHPFHFHYRLITLLPTVGCEADAATTYTTLERDIAASLAFGYLPTTGSYVAVWPVQGAAGQVIELEHCLVNPADEHSRVRVIQVLRISQEGLELKGIKVFCEQWYGPFRNGDQLGGCSIRDSAFASTPALDSSKISGVWQGTSRAFAVFQETSNHIKELADDEETGALRACSRDGDGVILLPKQLWCCSSFNQNHKDDGCHDFQAGWLLQDGLAIISTCSFSPNANLKEISITQEKLQT